MYQITACKNVRSLPVSVILVKITQLSTISISVINYIIVLSVIIT